MSLEKTIHKLEQDIIEFKASQMIGSSSSRVVPVGEVDIDLDSVWYAGIGLIGKFTTTNVVNPIIMPRLRVWVDGAEVTSESSSALMGLYYDDWECAMLINDWSPDGFVLPDEKTATFFLSVASNVQKSSLTNFKVQGIVYATCEGNLKLYTNATTESTAL